MRNTVEWRQSGKAGEENRFEGRRGLIVRAARTCFGRRGVAKTSIADITREVSITRELFYYYFNNKDLVVAAVMGTYIAEARAALDYELGDNPEDMTREEKIRATLRALYSWLSTDDEAQSPMVEILRETGFEAKVVQRVAREMVQTLQSVGALGSQGMQEAPFGEEPRSDGYQLAIAGAISAMLSDRTVSEDMLLNALMSIFG